MKPSHNVLKQHRVTSPSVTVDLSDFLRKRAFWAHWSEINRQPPSHGVVAPCQHFPLMVWANKLTALLLMCPAVSGAGILSPGKLSSCSPPFHHQTGGCSATPMVIFDQRQRVLICHLSPAKCSLPFGCQLVFHGIVPGYVYGLHLHQHSHSSHVG